MEECKKQQPGVKLSELNHSFCATERWLTWVRIQNDWLLSNLGIRLLGLKPFILHLGSWSQPCCIQGLVVLSLPRFPNSPASGAASLHFSQQASRECRLLIGCGEQAALPAAVTQGFRCEARAGEAVWTSAVGWVPRRLAGRGDQRVYRPGRFRPVRGITQTPREGSGRGTAKACAHARAGGSRAARERAGRGWLCARGAGGWGGWRAHVGPRAQGREPESSVPPRQSAAGSLSRAPLVVRGTRCAGKRLQEKGGLSWSSSSETCLGTPGSPDWPETGRTVDSLW